MSQPKTIREWLETLPDGYRERAIAAREGKACRAEMTMATYLREALVRGFWWDETDEGDRFWLEVCNWAVNPEKYQLPLLPGETIQSLKQRIAELEAALQVLLSHAATESRRQRDQDSDDPRLVGKSSSEHSSITAARKALAGKEAV